MSSSFIRPVAVQIGRHDRERVIFDVNDAATILLRSVPRPTENRKLAMDACLQVLRGEAQTPVARRAFVTAALEAKILRSD
ncbi:DUF982 domain-containing protein [Mesorhizobium sp. M1050]|uniref:DUF982 domain-containing protein n=1 Tax=Mesorhizobium sp. M1050 TaxID=2957051 RepID=UPI00333D41BC